MSRCTRHRQARQACRRLCVAATLIAITAGVGAGSHAAAAAHAQPRITISSPKAARHPSGTKLLIKFSCHSTAGIASCRGTLAGPGTKRRDVASGSRIRPVQTGSHTLRITARDRRGASATTTLRFIVERAIRWSGHAWFVRHPGWGGPGPNRWSDSPANVRVSGGELVLSIVRDKFGRWTSSEVDNQRHLGHGTYRWVVSSDLSKADPHQVLGMFNFGGTGPYADEIDLEASRWGNLLAPSGSAAVWQNLRTQAKAFTSFAYSDRPPYVHQFKWSQGRVEFLVTDAAGTVLLDWTVTAGVPKPSSEVPIINYWRFHGVPPSDATTVRLASFTWSPLGR